MSPTVSAIGMALNIEYERPPLGLNLDAHQDTAGNWQIGDGLTSLPDGRKVGPGMSLTPAEYAAASTQTLRKFEAGVLRLVSKDVQLNQYQFDALVFLAWNIGLAAFEDSSVLRMVNAERWEDAAYHFGEWVYATKSNKFDAEGRVIGEEQYGPDGVLLAEGQVWKRAYRGLYRRHLSEACLFLGLDWRDACHEDAIEMQVVHEKQDYGWRDSVEYKTPWADVLRVARNHPLPAPKMLGEKEAVMGKTLVLPDNWDDMSADQQTAWLNNDQTAKLKAKSTAAVIAPKKAIIETPNLKPDAKPKPLEESKSANGLAKKKAGEESLKAGGVIAGTTAVTAAVREVTGVAKEATKTATDATGFVMGFTLQQLMLLGLIGGLFLLTIGVYRWRVGKYMLYEGRQEAEGPKI